jgi:hypothetical protein
LSLLPRRLRAGHAGQVAVHPGWTLSPPIVVGSATAADPAQAAHGADLPASRWTSAPALPTVLATPAAAPLPVPPPVPAVMVSAAREPLSFWVEAPAAPIATVLSAPLPRPAAVEAAVPSWTQEWESVAATPTTSGGATALHTAAAVALDAIFGGPAPEPAAASPVAPAPQQPQPLEPQPVAAALTALDLPLPAYVVAAETPLAAQASAFLQAATPPLPAPLPVPIPAPPPTPPRTLAVPAPAAQIVEQAVRTAASAPVQRRSTVRLGFADASVVDLRPDDPMAKALHTVADALIGREAS